jgi:hypothetical protein
LQALDLMNDVTFLEAARKLAERMMMEGGLSDDARLAFGVRLLLARPPRAAEAPILRAALKSAQHKYEANPDAAAAFLKQGESPITLPKANEQAGPGDKQNRDRAGADLEITDLAAYTVVASLLLNMDATISKE